MWIQMWTCRSSCCMRWIRSWALSPKPSGCMGSSCWTSGFEYNTCPLCSPLLQIMDLNQASPTPSIAWGRVPNAGTLVMYWYISLSLDSYQQNSVLPTHHLFSCSIVPETVLTYFTKSGCCLGICNTMFHLSKPLSHPKNKNKCEWIFKKSFRQVIMSYDFYTAFGIIMIISVASIIKGMTKWQPPARRSLQFWDFLLGRVDRGNLFFLSHNTGTTLKLLGELE